MVTIINYGMGNLGSIQNMLKRLGHKSVITDNPAQIAEAQKLILPGVGAFDAGVHNLKERGQWDILQQKVLEDKTPILGICLGMQLMTQQSEEGILKGLGWVDGETIKFKMEDKVTYKIPHMGWTPVKALKEHPLLGIEDKEARFYFVHSYYVKMNNETENWLESTYCHPFTSGFAKDNIMGVQFHPEKSHKYGMQLLQNFVTYF